MTANRILIALSLFIFLSCEGKRENLGPQAYLQYHLDPENGLRQTQQLGDITYRVQFRTPEMIALMENHGEVINPGQVQNRVKSLDSMAWFEVFIQTTNSNIDPLKYEVADLNEYNSRLNYYLSTFAKTAFCVYKDMEIPCLAYHFENNYSLRNGNSALMGFKLPTATAQNEIVLQFDDEVFRNKNIRFVFTENNLLKVPTLNL